MPSSPTGEPVNGNRLAEVPSTAVPDDDACTAGGCRVNDTPETQASPICTPPMHEGVDGGS